MRISDGSSDVCSSDLTIYRAYPAFLAIDRLADRLPHHFLAGAVQRLGETMESRRVECRLGFLARRRRTPHPRGEGGLRLARPDDRRGFAPDRRSTRLNSSP